MELFASIGLPGRSLSLRLKSPNLKRANHQYLDTSANIKSIVIVNQTNRIGCVCCVILEWKACNFEHGVYRETFKWNRDFIYC